VKVKTWVEFEQEVEVEVSIADCMSSIEELAEGDRMHMTLDCINRVYGALRRVPTERIEQMNDKQREIIVNGLREQAMRFEKRSGEATPLGQMNKEQEPK
jgi:hypothetical protein